MKKSVFVLLTAGLLVLSGCSAPEEPSTLKPDAAQMQAICELSVMECYYHNVAKFYDEDVERFLFWTKDKEFWIEYSGIVRLGIDVNEVTIAVNEDTVTVTLPDAKVLGCEVDSKSLNKDSYIIAEGSAKVTADDQTKAFAAAQANMEKSAATDDALLSMARSRTQQLLEEYIRNVSEVSGHTYTITWQDTVSDADLS